MNWFYAKDGQPAGPVDESDLQRLAAAGAIVDSTLVWHSGLPGWKPYAEVRPTPVAPPPALPVTAGPDDANALSDAPAAAPYAGFWIRAMAFLFDGLIMMPLVVVVFLAFFIEFPDFLSLNANEGGGSRTLCEFTLLAFSAIYETFFVGRFGATPGKWVCDLCVVRPDGAALSYSRSLARHFAKRLSSIFLLGYIIVPFDAQRRALHDYLCDTRVVRKG